MAFLSFTAVAPRKLADIKETGLLMPTTARDGPVLVAAFKQQLIAVILSPGNDQFRGFTVQPGIAWSGLFVSDVQFEVDPASVVDRYTDDIRTGCLQMGNGCGQIVAGLSDRGFLERVPVPFAVLEGMEDAEDVAFRIWRIVTGSGQDKQVLFEHSVG